MNHPLLLGLFWTVALIGTVILTAGLVSLKYGSRIRIVMLPVILWIAFFKCFPCAINLFSGSDSLPQKLILLLSGVVFLLLSIVFTFGSLVICTQPVDFEEHKIKIVKGSPLYKVLVTFAGFDPEKHNNLCALSWFGTVAIAASFFIVIVYWIIEVITGFFVFLIWGANPFGYISEVSRRDGFFVPKVKKLGNFPLSPMLILFLVSIVWLMTLKAMKQKVFLDLCVILFSFILAVAVLKVFLDFLTRVVEKNAEAEQKSKRIEKTTKRVRREQKKVETYGWFREVFWPSVCKAFRLITSQAMLIIMASKKKVCPGISLIDKIEM